MLHGYRYGCISIKRRTSGEHLIHDDTERVHIGGRVHDLPLSLLGCVVLNRTKRHACGSEALSIDIFVDAGNTEVGQLDRTIAPDQDILRLHVTMNDAPPVGSSQSKRNVVSDDDGAIHREDTTRTQIAAQVCSFYQLHHDEVVAIGLAIIVDLHYVGMLQCRCCFRFTLKARHKLWIGTVDFAQDFDGYDAIHTQILATINSGHTAPADWIL